MICMISMALLHPSGGGPPGLVLYRRAGLWPSPRCYAEGIIVPGRYHFGDEGNDVYSLPAHRVFVRHTETNMCIMQYVYRKEYVHQAVCLYTSEYISF